MPVCESIWMGYKCDRTTEHSGDSPMGESRSELDAHRNVDYGWWFENAASGVLGNTEGKETT